MSLTFNEEWFNEKIIRAVVASWEEIKHLDGDIIELGCWEGRSTVFMANMVYPEKLIAIDPHSDTSFEMEYFKSIGEERNTYEVFQNNIEIGTKGNVEYHRMGWQEFFAEYSGKIKFIYVDGPHDYDDVVAELTAIKPYLVRGAIVLGDDYYNAGVVAAFKEVLPSTVAHELAIEFTGIYREL